MDQETLKTRKNKIQLITKKQIQVNTYGKVKRTKSKGNNKIFQFR